MQRDIDQVIRQRIESPKCVLQPEAGEHQRIIEHRVTRPNVLEPERADDAGILCEMFVIVPDESRMPHRLISKERGDN